MKTQPISRRSLTAGLALAPLASLPVTAAALAQQPDPIFAAIDRHKAALSAFVAASTLTDEVVAKQEGRDITEADEAVYLAADGAEAAALDDLLATVPLTAAGAGAALIYLVEQGSGNVSQPVCKFIETLMQSPIFANNPEA